MKVRSTHNFSYAELMQGIHGEPYESIQCETQWSHDSDMKSFATLFRDALKLKCEKELKALKTHVNAKRASCSVTLKATTRFLINRLSCREIE